MTDKLNLDLIRQLPQFVQLQDTPQNPHFHGEGNVAIHTNLAVQALQQNDDWLALPDGDRLSMLLATLFHDIGKGVTTKQSDTGQWTSPKHGPVGARITRRLLWDESIIQLPFTEREKIVRLIQYHGLPLWAHDRAEIDYTLRCVSQLVSLEWLGLLSQADVRGRIAGDIPQLLERIHFFKQLSTELVCYSQPYPFANNYTRWSYYTKRHQDINYTPYDASWGEVVVLCGVPGSGKDTWIKEQCPNLSVVSLDDIRVELGVDPADKNQSVVVQLGWSRAKHYLAKRQPFIWNATNVQEQRRRELIDICTEYGARVKLIYIEAPYSALWERNKTRERPVPNQVLNRMIDALEVPYPYEAPSVEYWINGEKVV